MMELGFDNIYKTNSSIIARPRSSNDNFEVDLAIREDTEFKASIAKCCLKVVWQNIAFETQNQYKYLIHCSQQYL